MSVPGCFPRYELPQYGSRRRLLSPSGMYDEYGEVVVEGDGGYYYSPQGPTAEAEVCFFPASTIIFISQYSAPTLGFKCFQGHTKSVCKVYTLKLLYAKTLLWHYETACSIQNSTELCIL